MPHIIVKLWPGKSEQQKRELAEAITRDVVSSLTYSEDAVSVACIEVTPDDWKNNVYDPDIKGQPDSLYKKPGYEM